MDNYLTADIISVLQCHVLNEDPFLKEKEGVDITVCCNDGRVIELYCKDIVNVCNVPFLKPSSINVFYAYDPFVKYYIIKENYEIIILKRTDCLKIFTKFCSVQSYEINDILKIGKPQVKIWLKCEMEPVVTDFSDSLNNDTPEETLLLSNLNNRLNAMKLCLQEIASISENKKLCCESALSNLKNDDKSLFIDFQKGWQKVVDDHWIVCVFVTNISDHLVTNLYLLLDENVQIETKILKLSDSADKLRSFELFDSVACLTSHSSAYIVGIFSVPNFKFRKVISKTLSLLYRINETEGSFIEVKLPPFVLDTLDLLKGNLGLFNANKISIDHVITIMVVNEEIVLEVHFKNENIESELVNVLTEKLHFIKIKVDGLKPFCYIVRPQESFYISRFMLFIKQMSPTSYHFKCYVKHTKHLLLFVNILCNYSTSISSIFQKNKSCKNEIPILAAVNKLDDEFKHFSSVMKLALPSSSLPLKTEPKLQFSTAMWKELLESRLQFETDLKFQDALMENNS